MQEITFEQAWRAYKPLLDLLSVNPFEIYNEHPPTPSWDENGLPVIRFLRAIDPDKPREDWPTVTVGEGDFAELAYEVTVPLTGSVRAIDDLWPDKVTVRPAGVRA